MYLRMLYLYLFRGACMQAERKDIPSTLIPDAGNAAVGSTIYLYFGGASVDVPLFC